MPIISKFSGVTIKMYFRQSEHNPPHIHAFAGDNVGVFSIMNGDMYEGDISIKDQQMIREFIAFYREKLLHMWETQEFEKLKPLNV